MSMKNTNFYGILFKKSQKTAYFNQKSQFLTQKM